MLDYKIVGGDVYDGSGSPSVQSDIGVRGDRIVSIGDLRAADARHTIAASECIVTPGFIDVHSHSDAYLLLEPCAPSKIFQGVTTEVIGNCGCSAGPRLEGVRMPSDWQEFAYPRRWRSVAEYREVLEEIVPGVNVAMLVGHNNLRASVMGYEPRRADPAELVRMRRLLAAGFDAGAIGLSSGLLYSPGMFAGRDELIALLEDVADRNAVYTTHMRSEGAELIEAVDETLSVVAESGCRLEISHLKTSGPANWSKIDLLLERIAEAQSSGIAVAADRYPYTAACTDLDVILPEWAAGGERSEIVARMRDPADRARIRRELLDGRPPDYWGRVMIGSTFHPDNGRFSGQRLDQVARQLGLEPVDAALHLIETDELHTGGIFFGMSEENMLRILGQPYVMVGSDGSLRAPTGPLSHDHPHPRNYGAFTRFLKMAAGGEPVRLAEGIRKMTSLPAGHFGLSRRGLLEIGAFADIAVIDLFNLRENSTYARPHRLSEGVEHLLVNGKPVIAAGRPTQERNGRVL